MKIYLIAGNSGQALKNIIEKDSKLSVVKIDNTIDESTSFLTGNSIKFDVLLLIDQGIENNPQNFYKYLNNLKEIISYSYQSCAVKFITKEPHFAQVFKQIAANNANFEVHLIDNIKIPSSLIIDICKSKNSDSLLDTSTVNHNESLEKKSPFSLFKNAQRYLPIEKRDSTFIDSELNMKESFKIKSIKSYKGINLSIPNNLNRVVAITGHRGSGVTSTVANLAFEASIQGLSALVLDLDIEHRGINLYFNKFGEEVDLNPELATSLVKCLMKPNSYIKNSCRINDNLSVVSLAYSIQNTDKILEYIDFKKLLNFVSSIKSKFNVIFIDIPLKYFKDYPDLITQIDSIGLCINNTLYSMISTVTSMGNTLDSSNKQGFRMKAKTIITKANEKNMHQGASLTPEVVSNILTNISDIFDSPPECAGLVPYFDDFDLQIDTGRKLCTFSKQYKTHYLNILSNLL